MTYLVAMLKKGSVMLRLILTLILTAGLVLPAVEVRSEQDMPPVKVYKAPG